MRWGWHVGPRPSSGALSPVTFRHYSTSRSSRVGRSALALDRKSTRLNSSHSQISYAVFCLKKKNATNVFEHILMLPPIRLWHKPVPNDESLNIITRNPRSPDPHPPPLHPPCHPPLTIASRL